MAFDWLVTPVSDDAPCGPDLDATMDSEFDEYYFEALGRLPQNYVVPGVNRPDGSKSPDRVFDPKEVDAKAEAGKIEPLLKRSRDIRLLVLLAQWEVLAGRIKQMSDAVKGIADIIETFGDSAHPVIEGSPSARREAIGDLTAQTTIILPLQFLPLSLLGDVTIRRMHVARGEATALDGEEDLDLGALQRSLEAPENGPRVAEVHAAVLVLIEALSRISKLCQSGSAPFSANLDAALDVLNEMREVLNGANPDLRAAEEEVLAAVADEPASEDAQADAPETGAETGSPPPALTDLPALAVASHAEARQALVACEVYFRHSEPSSAALLLVTQARLLIGKPLIEALDILLPQETGRAVVEFGPQTGFALPIDRLRQLSGEAPAQGTAEPPPPEEVRDPPTVNNASDISAVLKGVEDFYRRCERSSPVPILLQRARSYLEKDFQAIVAELIPRAADAAAPAKDAG